MPIDFDNLLSRRCADVRLLAISLIIRYISTNGDKRAHMMDSPFAQWDSHSHYIKYPLMVQVKCKA